MPFYYFVAFEHMILIDYFKIFIVNKEENDFFENYGKTGIITGKLQRKCLRFVKKTILRYINITNITKVTFNCKGNAYLI